MAVKNTIAPQQKKTNQITEYLANGETIRLSPITIRNYLVSGGGNVSDQEVMMFLSLCRFQHLNPFMREAYLIKYSEKSPAAIVVGKDVFLKRAKRNANYLGKQAGIIVVDKESGVVTEREGEFYLSNEEIIGGWAKIFIKGYEQPEYSAVSFNEYAGRKADGSLNAQWSGKPATMIRKVALVHALREAFPEDYQGLYDQAEIREVSDIQLDESVVSESEPVQDSEPVKQEAPAAQSAADALFG